MKNAQCHDCYDVMVVTYVLLQCLWSPRLITYVDFVVWPCYFGCFFGDTLVIYMALHRCCLVFGILWRDTPGVVFVSLDVVNMFVDLFEMPR